ncbi:hypothetical protein [Streptomyces macrosporus]|uniref:Uncharacterized protein n=1 Tax=Streptomyces macrosporus TaxID=44032 RepID=A0ABN3K700_9ACTN
MTTGHAGGTPGIPRQETDPRGEPPGGSWNATTRYMCAGAHLDEGFARAVVEELRHEAHRACAPSYGVDLRYVCLHAERALEEIRRRDLGVMGSVAVAFLLAPLTTVVYVYALKLTAAGAGRRRALPGVRAAQRGPDGRERLEREHPLQKLMGALGIRLLALFGISALTAGVPLPWFSPGTGGAFLVGAVFLVGGPWFFAWRQQESVWRAISRELVPGAAPARKADLPSDVDLPRSATGGDANLIVYSGYQPFVGAGAEVSSWSFAMRLRHKDHRPGEDREPEPCPIDSGDLVEHLRERLTRLGTGAEPADSVRGLEVSEKVFVHGEELLSETVLGRHAYWSERALAGRVPRGRPADHLEPERVAGTRGLIDGPVRHCLCAQVRSWDGDLVLSVFLQAAVNGATLYLQSNTLVLTPVREEYRQADNLTERQEAGSGGRLAVDALSASTVSLSAPLTRAVDVLTESSRLEKRRKRQREVIEHNRRYDFGARRSLRQMAASGNYRSFFQHVDASRTGKQIELQVFAALLDLLARHDLDTGELEERRNTILNNGIIMTGGSMSGSVAAGQGATALSGQASRPKTGASGGAAPGRQAAS